MSSRYSEKVLFLIHIRGFLTDRETLYYKSQLYFAPNLATKKMLTVSVHNATSAPVILA